MTRLHRIALFGLVLVLFTIVSCTRTSNLDTLMEDLLSSIDGTAIQSAIDAIVAAEPAPAFVAQALRAGVTMHDDLELGWQIHEFACHDGTTRTIHLFVPSSYDPEARHTLLISLHGAVDHSAYTIAEFVSRYAMWESVAERDGFLVLMPHGDRETTWWSESGRQYIHGLVQWAKQVSNIDENKVFLGGFSDGAAGAYWMAFHDPTAWAGFIPIFGSVSSPERGPYQCYPSNLARRPILASNGVGEPYIRIEASLHRQLANHGVLIPWVLHPTEHNLSQTMPFERNRSAEFISQTARNPFSPVLSWKTSTPSTGRCDWISIDVIAADPTVMDAGDDFNLGWEQEIFHFGAGLQYQGEERGFEVAGIEPGSIAHSMGLKQGDKLLSLDSEPILTNMDVAAVMETQSPGQTLIAEVDRGGEILSLECVIPEIPLIYRRELPTATLVAEVSGNRIDVQTHNVASCRLFISSSQFDLDEPIRVVHNGEGIFNDILPPNLSFMLQQWMLDRDRRTVYEGVIEIAVSP